MITPAVARPPERQKEGHMVYMWGLAPGTAYKIDDDRREHVEVPITKAQAKGATYTYILRFIAGQTVAVFDLEGAQYGQPLPGGPAPAFKRPRGRAQLPRPGARTAAPVRRAPPHPAKAPRGAQEARRGVPKRVRLADLDL